MNPKAETDLLYGIPAIFKGFRAFEIPAVTDFGPSSSEHDLSLIKLIKPSKNFKI